MIDNDVDANPINLALSNKNSDTYPLHTSRVQPVKSCRDNHHFCFILFLLPFFLSLHHKVLVVRHLLNVCTCVCQYEARNEREGSEDSNSRKAVKGAREPEDGSNEEDERSAEFRREWSFAHEIMVKNTYFHVTVVGCSILTKTLRQKSSLSPRAIQLYRVTAYQSSNRKF